MRPPSKKDIFIHTVTWVGCGFTFGRLENNYSMVFVQVLLGSYLVDLGIGTFGLVFIYQPRMAISLSPVITTAWRVIVRG